VKLTRRTFIVAAGAGAVAGSLSSLSLAQGVRLRAYWWGNPDRDRRTKAMLDAYAKKSGTQIAAESLGWNDYWTKLATQTAGGNAPDLIQMDIFLMRKKQSCAKWLPGILSTMKP